MKQAKGVLFDYNGTLVFDSALHERAWRIFLRGLSGREVAEREFLEKVHGRSNDEILAYFLGGPLPEEEARRLGEEKEAVYRRLCREPGSGYSLVAGAAAFFCALQERGVPFAMATSSCASNVDFYFEALGLGRWFARDRVIYDDGTLRCKPAPDIYLRAAERLGLAAEDCIVFEDAPAGVAAARAAGAGAVLGVAATQQAAMLLREKWGVSVMRDFTAAAADAAAVLALPPLPGKIW